MSAEKVERPSRQKVQKEDASEPLNPFRNDPVPKNFPKFKKDPPSPPKPRDEEK